MPDELVEKVARAIANCEWDMACSALGTPNFPRGGNWTAKLPQAKAAIAAMPRIGALVEALGFYADRANYQAPMEDGICAVAVDRGNTARAALQGESDATEPAS